MKNSRVLVVIIIVLIVIGALIYSYYHNSSSPVIKTTGNTESLVIDSSQKPLVDNITTPLSQDLVYFSKEDLNGVIYSTNGLKPHILFTDVDVKQKLLTVGNISPESHTVLALMSLNRAATIGDLYQISLDGKGKLTLISSDFATTSALSPQFSPDGTTIAYPSGENDQYPAVNIMALDGSNIRQIAYDQDGILSFAWSPDSQSIAYIGGKKDNAKTIKIASISSPATPVLLYKTTNNTLSDISWANNNELFFLLTNQNSQSAIAQASFNQKNNLKIIISSIIKPNQFFLSSNHNDLAYLDSSSTQSTDTINNILVWSFSDRHSQVIGKGLKIIGWLP